MMLRMGDIMLAAAILVIVAVLLGACGSIASSGGDGRPLNVVDEPSEHNFKNRYRRLPNEKTVRKRLGNASDRVCDPEIMPTPEGC